MSLLAVEDLAISFGGVQAVRGVSFEVRPKEILALIGPNGAGKTTIFNLVSRVYEASGGRILFEGVDLRERQPHELAGLGLARTFQNIELFEHATVLQNLLIGRHARARYSLWREALFTRRVRDEELAHRDAVEQVIDFLRLQAHRDAVVQGLPYGVRKVVELGRALCAAPKLLLLDEPSSGLNPEETEDMGFWISDLRTHLGITVLLIEHDMGLVDSVSDRVLALDLGKVLVCGSPGEVKRHPGVVRAYLG